MMILQAKDNLTTVTVSQAQAQAINCRREHEESEQKSGFKTKNRPPNY